jgi:hypothetical protein
VCMRRKINKREQRDNLQTLQRLFCRPTNKMFTNIRNLALYKKMKVPWPKKVALHSTPKKKRQSKENLQSSHRERTLLREKIARVLKHERECEREKERERQINKP